MGMREVNIAINDLIHNGCSTLPHCYVSSFVISLFTRHIIMCCLASFHCSLTHTATVFCVLFLHFIVLSPHFICPHTSCHCNICLCLLKSYGQSPIRLRSYVSVFAPTPLNPGIPGKLHPSCVLTSFRRWI